MKVAIVIGGTGLVGKALVALLAADDNIERVVSLSRREVLDDNDKVENHVVDFDNLSASAELFKGDVFFSCLGTTKKQAGSIEAQRRVDLDYQYQAAQLAAEQGVVHYLLVSSSGADASSGNAYLKMKGELEVLISRLAFKRISIMQPSLLLGERDHFRLGEIIGSWILPLLCKLPGLTRYRPIEGQQVAEKMKQVSRTQGEGMERFVLNQVFPDQAG